METQPTWFDPVLPVVEALARLLHPHGEIVLHDLGRDRVLGIWNNLSQRKVGDASLLSQLPAAPDDEASMGPYERVTIDGRRMTSVSAVLRDADGKPRGVLCINLDRSPVDHAVAMLSALAPQATEPRPAGLFERDWREQIALLVDTWCRDHLVARSALTRTHRLEIVKQLQAADLFATRNAAQHVAAALGCSRATVYTLLNEVKAIEGAA
jgi:D-arginine utilization repressor